MFLWLLLVLVILLGWYYLWSPLKYWKNKGVPQTNPWIILGDIWPVLFRQKSYSEYSQWIYEAFPDKRYVGYYQFTRPILMIRDPDLIKQITIKDFEHFTDHGFYSDENVDPLWAKNLFSLKGQKWRNMRVTMTRVFTSAKMKILFNLICEASKSFTNYFDFKPENYLEIDFKDTFSRLTNDAIASVAFGIKVDSLKEPKNEVYLMGRQAFDFASFTKSLRFILPPKILSFFKIPMFDKPLADFFCDIVYQNIKDREEKNIFRPDMINVLLQAKKRNEILDETDETVDTGFATAQHNLEWAADSKKVTITDFDIAAQAFVFFFGAFESVSAVLAFGTYELAVNLDVQEKLRQEIMDTLEYCDGKLSYETLLGMRYMDMVVSEILRKWSPASNLDRVCTKAYTIQPVKPDESPVEINVGDYIALPYSLLHWDPKYWPQPEKFIPERFSEENRKNIQPYTYSPFGEGPRNCIGSRYALLATKTMLFYLLSKYEVVPSEKSQIPLKLRKSFLHLPQCNWYGLKRLNKS